MKHKVIWTREFSAKAKATGWNGNLPRVSSTDDLKETWVEFSAGVRGKLSKNVTAYLDVGTRHGNVTKQDYSIKCGINVKF